jgi:trigger factor
LKISSDRIEGCQVVLNVEAEAEEMERALEGTYRRLVKQAIVPGFRKGKAPRPMLERHFGRTALLNDASERLVPELYEQAIKGQGIEAFGSPQVEITHLDPLTFKATVPVRPVVELGDYRSVKVTPKTVEITGDQIDEAMINLRRRQALWEPVEREARMGDVVGIYIESWVEGNTLLDKRSEWYLLADSTLPVPGFAAQIEGMKAGDEKEFTLPFPEDHSNFELAGKNCLFKVSISEVKEEHLPELNDEFAKSLGEEVETMDQLREKVAGNLKAVADGDARNKLERQVVEAVVGQANLEFPAIVVGLEIDRMVQQQMIALGGVHIDDYLKLRNLTSEQYRDQLQPVAEKRVANSLVLKKVAQEEKMEVGESEIDAEIRRRVENAGDEGERVQEMLSSPKARDSLREELLQRKAIDFLVGIATGV